MVTFEDAKKAFKSRDFESVMTICTKIAENDSSMLKETDLLMAKAECLLYLEHSDYGEEISSEFEGGYISCLSNAYGRAENWQEVIDISEEFISALNQGEIDAVDSTIESIKQGIQYYQEFDVSVWQDYINRKVNLISIIAVNGFLETSKINEFRKNIMISDEEVSEAHNSPKYNHYIKDSERKKICCNKLLSTATKLFAEAVLVYSQSSSYISTAEAQSLCSYLLKIVFRLPLLISCEMPDEDDDYDTDLRIKCLKEIAVIKDWLLKTRVFFEGTKSIYLISGSPRYNMVSELEDTYAKIKAIDSSFEVPSIPEKYVENAVSDTSGGCYVATAVYGSYDCPQVWTLRRFRDYTLAETWYGRLFIRTYYAISPTLVKWFGNTEWFKKMWKGTLDKMVNNLNAEGVEDTPYEDRNW